MERKKISNYGKLIKFILFIIMLILIYIVSPKITNIIQNGARWIYELDNNYITRIVEIILCVLFISIVIKPKKKGE